MCINMWHPEVGTAKNLLHALRADTLAPPPVSNTCLRPCIENMRWLKIQVKLYKQLRIVANSLVHASVGSYKNK